MPKISRAEAKTISVVIPFFNEAGNIQQIYSELVHAYSSHFSEYNLEIIFMDNHSKDDSFKVAKTLADQDSRIKIIRMSRNFGYQANIYTGFINSTGDAVVQLDADGEDDPVLIKEFINRWRFGFDVVYGIRNKRFEAWWLTLSRKIFYRLLNRISEVEIPIDAGDFRLVDRKVVASLRTFKESNLYLRGIISYIGFKQTGILYDRRPRYGGMSKFNLTSYFSMAFSGITSFSKAPLVFLTWVGFLISSLSGLGAAFYFILYLTGGVKQQGFTTLVLIVLLMAGIQLLGLGLIGLYVGRIFDEVKFRPRSIIEIRYPNSDSNELGEIDEHRRHGS